MKKKLLALLLCIGLMLIFLPQVAQAADDYTFIDENGDTQTTGELTVTPIMEDTDTLTTGWYVVDSNVTRSEAITVSGNVNLILVDSCTLTVTGSFYNAGINVSAGNSLTVYGQAGGTGTLYAQGSPRAAGIGSGDGGTVGTINICSGTVTAIGGSGTYHQGMLFGSGAGIGGGYSSTSGTINIFGGTVTAKGGEAFRVAGAGIGGGGLGAGGQINISGGIVQAISGEIEPCDGAGAGIGGGGSGEGGTIVISGGEVTATGGDNGAGIGGGDRGSGGSITIRGGKVNASSKYGGAGIGGGSYAVGGTINIQGGDITASGGMWGAGIGSGGAYNAGDITITGGTVNAIGGEFGAGIGSGGTNSPKDHNGGTIKILGGKVIAKGGSLGMDAGLDIGRGRNGINGTLLIDDAALVRLTANGIDSSVTTLGTCIIQGSAAGALLGAYEDGTKINVTMIDISDPALSNGTGFTISGDTITLTGGGNTYVLFDNTIHRRFVVSSGKTVNVILFSANIRPTSGCAFNMTGATVNMRLVGNNSLSSSGNFAGLQVPADSTLSINGSGILTTTGGNDGGAGIGGGSGGSAGSMTFSGGSVSAVGGGGGAGIGGGNGGAGSSVLVDGENTMVSSSGDQNGYDIGSGHNNSNGGSLTLKNNATVNLNRNGTNTNTSFIDGIVGGDGAELLAGTYSSSQKLLTCSNLIAAPSTDVKAFDNVKLTAYVTGLSETDPQGQIAFFDNSLEIGRASLIRIADGSAEATADFIWSSRGGIHMITAHYVQDYSDSYYMTDSGELEDYEVAKTEQAPLTISGIPDTVTYGDASFPLSVTGGNGTGTDLSYSVTSGDAVSVSASGIVTVEKAGQATITVTKAGDGNYLSVSADVIITVNKAIPAAVVFPSAAELTYGQPLSDSVLTGGSVEGTFAWEEPDTIPTVINSGYRVLFTPDDTDNYLTASQIVAITVKKAQQATLNVGGIPSTVTYGDSPFDLSGSGGSGTGIFSYSIASGDAVSVSLSGAVTVEKAGQATITITKAGDSNYLSVSADVTITVNKAIPPTVVFPSAAELTYGQPLSDSALTGGSGVGSFVWESADAIPTVINNGYNVIFTPNDTHNYLTIKRSVGIVVNKVGQAPLVVSGIPDTITFGDAPFRITVDGGSGTGALSYTVVSGDAVAVDAAGKVTIVHAGIASIKVANLGDDNYLPVSHTLLLTVNKAAQKNALTFALPESIAYGDAPFQISGSGGSGSGAFSYSVDSDDVVSVSETGMVTVLRPGDAIITAVKAGDSNYLSQTKKIRISVNKGIQNALIISGVPARVVAGQAPFSLSVSGGSGTGLLSYTVSSGNAVSVDGNGTVTVLKKGKALLTVTKAADEYYLATMATVEIDVKGTASKGGETPSASPVPSAAPTATAAPGPIATSSPTATAAASPSTTNTDTTLLRPLSAQAGEQTGVINVTISIDDLPEGTTAIRLPSGEILQIDPAKNVFELSISQEDLNEDGELEIIALSGESTPLGNYRIDFSDDAWQAGTADNGDGIISVLVWIAAAALVIGVMSVVMVRWNKKAKRFPK